MRLLVRVLIVVAGHGDDPQADTAAGRAIEGFIDVLVVGEVVPARLEFLGGVDFPKHRLGDALSDLVGVYHRVLMSTQHPAPHPSGSRGIPVAGDIGLGLEPLQRGGDRGTESNLIRADIVHHQVAMLSMLALMSSI